MYDVKKGYLPSPFNALYENTDFDISDQPHIQQVIKEVLGIEELISGEVEPNYVATKVKLNELSFVSSGSWLWKMRTFKNYKETHKNFKDWCRDAVGKSYNTVMRLINAATVWIELASYGFDVLPTSVSQCTVLQDLKGDELYEAWNKVVSNLEPHQITESSIRVLLYGEEPAVNTTVKFPIDLYEKLWEAARDAGTNIIQLVGLLYYEVYTKVSNLKPEAMDRWEEEMNDFLE